MKGIDISIGLEYAGEDEELYREILTEYAACIEEQAQAVEQALAAEDIETFVIEVHSLKSTSRTIGAQSLADQAKELEEYGKRCEWEQVRIGTPKLLSAYRGLYSVITAYCTDGIQEEQESEKRPVDHEAVGALLAQLTGSLEAYDSVRAEEVIAELAKYDLEEEFAIYQKKLVAAMGKFDYEGCKEAVMRWCDAWK